MDLDATALWFATRSPESYKRIREAGVDEDLFTGTPKAGFQFLVEYLKKHGELPGIGVISEETGCVIRPPEEGDEVSVSYLVERLHQRAIHRSLKYGLQKSFEFLEEDKQSESVSEVLKLADHLRKRRVAQVQLRTLGQVAPEVLEMYERTKRGEIGIPLPWPTMTAMTLGLWPGTLSFFVARPGVGKTWTAVIIALHAWAAGYKVLIVSPELGRVELGERLVAKYGEFNYGDMVTARLGSLNEGVLRDKVAELQLKGENFWILDDEDHLSPASIEQAIETIEPHIVLIDSVYMMKVADGKVKGKGPGGGGGKGGRYDRILETVDWLRSSSRRYKLPFIGISQLSRDAKQKKGSSDEIKKGRGTGGLEDAVAMSDTLFMDAHNLFALYQDQDLRLDKQLIYVPLKVRRQASISHVVINWDMTTMNFSEIGTFVPNSESKSSGYEDDEYESAF